VLHVPGSRQSPSEGRGGDSPAASATPSSRSPSPRKGRLTLGFEPHSQEPPFDLVDFIIGDLELEYDVATMTPQKLQRYTEQLQKALPVAALPERERSRSPR
jgi:hypothetical protein